MTGERASFEAHVRRASRKLDNALCAYSPPDADSFLDSALAHHTDREGLRRADERSRLERRMSVAQFRALALGSTVNARGLWPNRSWSFLWAYDVVRYFKRAGTR